VSADARNTLEDGAVAFVFFTALTLLKVRRMPIRYTLHMLGLLYLTIATPTITSVARSVKRRGIAHNESGSHLSYYPMLS
jgi:hypothetical protein